MSEEKKTFQTLIEYLEANKRKTAVYFDTVNYPKFKNLFTAANPLTPVWKNNPSTYLAELLITLLQTAQATPLLKEGQGEVAADNSKLIEEIEAAHREAVIKINATHGKQVGELNRMIEVMEIKVQELMEENTNLQTEVDDSQATLKILRQQVEGIAAKKTALIDLSQRYLSRSSFTEELNKIIP